MIDEDELKQICSKYKIVYKYFPNTNIIILNNGLDEWLIKCAENNKRPYILMHKNIRYETSKFHTQGKLKTLHQALDRLVNHKKYYSYYDLPKLYIKKH